MMLRTFSEEVKDYGYNGREALNARRTPKGMKATTPNTPGVTGITRSKVVNSSN